MGCCRPVLEQLSCRLSSRPQRCRKSLLSTLLGAFAGCRKSLLSTLAEVLLHLSPVAGTAGDSLQPFIFAASSRLDWHTASMQSGFATRVRRTRQKCQALRLWLFHVGQRDQKTTLQWIYVGASIFEIDCIKQNCGETCWHLTHETDRTKQRDNVNTSPWLHEGSRERSSRQLAADQPSSPSKSAW